MTRAGHLTLGSCAAASAGGIEGLHELRHPAGFAQLGGQRGHVAGVVGGLGRVGQVEVAHKQAQAAEHPRAAQQEEAPAVAADPQQPAQAVVHRPGERVDLDDPGDQVRSRRRGDGRGPARDGVPDDDRGPAQVTDQREQVAGDVGAGDRRPAHAGLAVPAQVRAGHPVAGLGQHRGQEPVVLPADADAVREHHQRAAAGHVVGDPAARNIKELGHGSSPSACDREALREPRSPVGWSWQPWTRLASDMVSGRHITM